MKILATEIYQHVVPDEWHADMILKTEKELFQLPEIMPEIGVFIGQPYYVTKDLLEKLPNLKWIQITGAGYEKADIEEVKKRGIRITNTRGIMSVSIAEDIFCKMLCFSRRVFEFKEAKKEKRWENFNVNQWMGSIYTDLSGKTLGLVGAGSISNETAARAKAFGMKTIAYGRTDKGNNNFDEFVTGEEGLSKLAEKSDYIAVAIPYSRDTHHLLGTEFFVKCRKDAILINVARGGVIAEEELIRALKTERIQGAALDVFETEPLPEESEIWNLENVFITSHKAGMGDSWIKELAELIEENLKKFKEGKEMENEIIDYKSEQR